MSSPLWFLLLANRRSTRTEAEKRGQRCLWRFRPASSATTVTPATFSPGGVVSLKFEKDTQICWHMWASYYEVWGRLWLLSVYLVMILVAVVLTHTILWKGDGCIIMGNAKICVQAEKSVDKKYCHVEKSFDKDYSQVEKSVNKRHFQVAGRHTASSAGSSSPPLRPGLSTVRKNSQILEDTLVRQTSHQTTSVQYI